MKVELQFNWQSTNKCNNITDFISLNLITRIILHRDRSMLKDHSVILLSKIIFTHILLG